MTTRKPGAPARLADVARAAGVGTSIASRVLNGDPTVSVRPETRERILAVARKLDYRPNALARGLKLARTMSFGLVINLAFPENLDVVEGVQRRAAEAGYVTLLADASAFLERGEAYSRLLLERRVDGFLFATLLATDAQIRDLDIQGLPLVLVNRRIRGISASATVDDAEGMRLAVEHLISLGHRRIAHIAGPGYADVARRRLAGYRAALKDAGLAAPRKLVVESPLGPGGSYSAMERLLALEPPPTAVAIWSFGSAPAALAAARAGGFKLPEELSFIAFHDAPLADYLEPALTTVRMPLREMAERGVDCLLGVIEGHRPTSVVVGTLPLLVERASVAPPPT